MKIVIPMVIFEKKKNPDPQVHQILKPITKLFCTFLPISWFKLRFPLKDIKVWKKYKTKKMGHFSLSLQFHFTFIWFGGLVTHSLPTIKLGESYPRTSLQTMNFVWVDPYGLPDASTRKINRTHKPFWPVKILWNENCYLVYSHFRSLSIDSHEDEKIPINWT